MGYSPWGRKESDMTERLTLSLLIQTSRGLLLYELLYKQLHGLTRWAEPERFSRCMHKGTLLSLGG